MYTGTVMPQMVPPKWVPPDHLANYIGMDVPPGPSTAAIDGPPVHLWRRKWSPVATHGPP